MSHLVGKNWSGNLLFNTATTASGYVNGYSWYLQLKVNSWTLEIAEEPSIEPSDLPLVGYGCGGWLYECDNETLPINKADLINHLNHKIELVFIMFHQNKLEYFPSVTCPCSD